MMKRYCRGTLALACACLYGTPALAQENEEDLAAAYGDNRMVSIATGARQSLRRAPAVATVITAEEMAAMGATDLDQVLETVPGLHVNHSPSMNSTQYVIRGVYSLYTPQVLMLQNGIPMTTLLVGGKGNLWAGLPLENIARIEVIRGPGSALYGADAFSGVINIITKTAADIDGTEFGARVGSFNTRDAWVQHGGDLGPAKIAAYFRVGSTDGFKKDITRDAATGFRSSLTPGTTNTGFDSVDGALDLTYDKWHWRAGYKLRDDIGDYIGLASALDPVGRGKSERITTDLGWSDDNFTENWGLALDASFMQYKQRYPVPAQIYPPGTTFIYPPGTPAIYSGAFPNGMRGGPETSERQLRLSAAATYNGFSGHSVRLGVGHDDLNMYETREYKNFLYIPGTTYPYSTGQVVDSPFPFLAPHKRLVNYVYAQDEWGFARDWTLTMGLRHDNYSDSGGTTNPRFALVWDATLDFTAKLLYGAAYRAPNFNEQYSTNNPIASGNSSLRPETNRTWEAAFSWQARQDWQLGVNLFRYDMKDIIRPVANPVPTSGSTNANTGKQHGSGMELETTWDAGRNLRFTGNYSYQRSIDESTDTDAGYAPHHHLYARGDWRFSSGWLASGQVNYVADRKRAARDARPQIPDYTTVDLTLRTQRGKDHQWDFAASIRNLFNATVLEPSMAPGTLLPNDLPMPGRSLYLQAVYSL